MNVNTSIPSKRHAPSRAGGFTLVELLVVISIMLLMLKLTLPSLRGLMGSNKHSVARGQLIGDLNRARTMAMNNGAPVYMVFMPAYNNFYVKPTLLEINRATPALRPTLQLLGTFQLQMAKQYLSDPKEGNDLLGKQAVAYALYAEFLPGDPFNIPSKRWLTDWKRLPEGFHFARKDLEDISISAAAGELLTFSNLKNGHSRGATNSFGKLIHRQMLLPYLMFNGEGELSVRGEGGMRGNSFLLSITDGGVFQPALDKNGTYSVESAERPEVDPDTGLPKGRRTWVKINSITGRADVWGEESAPVDQTKLHIDLEIKAITLNDAEIPVMKDKIDEWILKNAKAEAVNEGPWSKAGWSNPDPNNQGRRTRLIDLGADSVKITGLPKGKYPVLMTFLRRMDPGIMVSSKRVTKK